VSLKSVEYGLEIRKKKKNKNTPLPPEEDRFEKVREDVT